MKQKMRILSTLLFSPLAGFAVGEIYSPNVIIILADDMGWGDVGFNGCTDISTPAIDSIAANGIRFTDGYVMAPQCAPSRSALMTGKNQNRVLANNNASLDIVGLAAGPIFANHMKSAGYRTGIVGKWHLGKAVGQHPLDRGFDEFFGFLGGGSAYFPAAGSDSVPRLFDGRKPAKVSRYLTDEFGDRAVKFINENKGQSFFLYLAFNAPHTPLQAPPEEVEKFRKLKAKDSKLRMRYAAMVSILDTNIRKVLETLKTQGIEKDTLVVFLSDNGGPEKHNGSDNGPLRGAKGDTLEGGIRVPFALQWPARVKAGQTIAAPVLSIDLLPTALAAAGAPIPADLEGANLLPALSGKSPYPERVINFLFTTLQGRPETWWWAIRDGNWKQVYFHPPNAGSTVTETGLFNLAEDIGESKDLSAMNPEVNQRLLQTHDQWIKGLPAPFSNFTEQQIKQAREMQQASHLSRVKKAKKEQSNEEGE